MLATFCALELTALGRLGTHAAVTFERQLGTLFDGIDFAVVEDSDVGTGLLKNLMEQVRLSMDL